MKDTHQKAHLAGFARIEYRDPCKLSDIYIETMTIAKIYDI